MVLPLRALQGGNREPAGDAVWMWMWAEGGAQGTEEVLRGC